MPQRFVVMSSSSYIALETVMNNELEDYDVDHIAEVPTTGQLCIVAEHKTERPENPLAEKSRYTLIAETDRRVLNSELNLRLGPNHVIKNVTHLEHGGRIVVLAELMEVDIPIDSSLFNLLNDAKEKAKEEEENEVDEKPKVTKVAAKTTKKD